MLLGVAIGFLAAMAVFTVLIYLRMQLREALFDDWR